MTTATMPSTWRSRSGREYVPSGGRVKHGGLASVRRVTPLENTDDEHQAQPGQPLALKEWREGNEGSLDQLQYEVQVQRILNERAQTPPCPKLEDLIGEPLVTGIIMEWCPVDLGAWWKEWLLSADGFGRLIATLSDITRKVAEAHRILATAELTPCHGDLKPSNILLSQDGRWLVSDFGTTRIESKNLEITAPVLLTDHFLAPEVLFGCQIHHPGSIDTWSLAMTLFALLRMRKEVIDGRELPPDLANSPRFSMERARRVLRQYERDSQRYEGAKLGVMDFGDPLKIPENDRLAVRDALKGVFNGVSAPDVEEELSGLVLDLLDRALSIDPAHRYTDARDFAAALDGLTTRYIALSAQLSTLNTTDLELTREQILALNRDLSSRNRTLRLRVNELEGNLGVFQGARPPLWWGVGLALVLTLQLATLVFVAFAAWFFFR